MIDFVDARTKMVDCQVRTVDVTDLDILSSMMSVPREEFVPEKLQALAYIDEDLSLDFAEKATGRRLIEAGPFAKMLQLADVKSDDLVLDVGCGSGYTTAVLSLLSSSVVAIEQDQFLVEYASQKLMDLGYHNAAVVHGQLNEGCEREGPYDVIILEGSVDYVPAGLFDQLKDGGRLVAVEGHGNAADAKLYTKSNGLISSRNAFNCALAPIPGFVKSAEFEF